MLPIGTRVCSTYSPNRIFGEVVGYGIINGYTLDLLGNAIEATNSTDAVYLVRLDKMIVDEVTDETFRAARVIPLRETFTQVILTQVKEG